ncbi:MAG: TetR/AcrR family transcriptional regulator [Thermoleophilia bacterium]
MPRAGLTADRVVAEAADLADRSGLDSLTLAALADRLGIRVPSLYKHVDGLGGVQRELAVLGVRGLIDAVSAATVGRSGPDALRECCRAVRGYAHRHPGRYAAIQRAPDRADPAEREFAELGDRLVGLLLDVLRGYDLTGDDCIHAARTLRSAVHGFVAIERLGGFGLPADVDASFEVVLDMLDAGLRSLAAGGDPR